MYQYCIFINVYCIVGILNGWFVSWSVSYVNTNIWLQIEAHNAIGIMKIFPLIISQLPLQSEDIVKNK